MVKHEDLKTRKILSNKEEITSIVMNKNFDHSLPEELVKLSDDGWKIYVEDGQIILEKEGSKVEIGKDMENRNSREREYYTSSTKASGAAAAMITAALISTVASAGSPFAIGVLAAAGSIVAVRALYNMLDHNKKDK